MFSLYTHAHTRTQATSAKTENHFCLFYSPDIFILSNDCPEEIGTLTFTDTQSVSEIHHAKKVPLFMVLKITSPNHWKISCSALDK